MSFSHRMARVQNIKKYLPNPSKRSIEKEISKYYEDIRKFEDLSADNELTLEIAFRNLLQNVGSLYKFTVIKEKIIGTKESSIIPDGILVDQFRFRRGLWEAKRPSTNLKLEIKEKIQQGYPLRNIIFENTGNISLYQNGKIVFDEERLDDRDTLFGILHTFFSYYEPDISDFYEALEIFKQKIPELASALNERIEMTLKQDERFRLEIDEFIKINIRISNETMTINEVKELLIQHLLTERLFRTLFDNPEFVKRNTIAKEVEKLVDILARNEFSRDAFFRSINHFYNAIEKAAKAIGDFFERQAFLNEVYQTFFKSYSPKKADTHGIVYTPKSIVQFMVYYTNVIIEKEFNRSLYSRGIEIIDPCVGTGTFILEILNNIKLTDLDYKYTEDIFCNDIMLLPYYISSANIEYAYYSKTKRYLKYNNITHADSLELVHESPLDAFFESNAQVAKRQLKKSFFVIIGNPPYNTAQQDANENNPNPKHDYIDKKIHQTYVKYSKAKLKSKLYDPYVKFFRWATEKLNNREGVICFITNNSFITGKSFDGMRKQLLKDFSLIYHLDLGGNVYKNPKLSGTKHNVFGIKVGVGITFLVKSKKRKDSTMFYGRVKENLTRYEKEDLLIEFVENKESVQSIFPSQTQLMGNGFLDLTGSIGDEAFGEGYIPLFDEENSNNGIFLNQFPGINTARNAWVYDHIRYKFRLKNKMEKTIQSYNSQVDLLAGKMKRLKKDKVNVSDLVEYDKLSIKWDAKLLNKAKSKIYAEDFDDDKVVTSLFRPFVMKLLYFDPLFIARPSKYKKFVSKKNYILLTSGAGARKVSSLVTNTYPNWDALEKTRAFPLYVPSKGRNGKEDNISDTALKRFRKKLGDKTITKEDILFYVYGILNHPEYISKYYEYMQSFFPQIPISANFKDILEQGKKLFELHLNFENLEPYDSVKLKVSEDTPVFNYSISKMKLKGRNTLVYNDWITFEDIPEDCFEYRVNGRSPLEWIIDQYKNIDFKEDDWMIQYIKSIIKLSVESVAIIKEIGRYDFH